MEAVPPGEHSGADHDTAATANAIGPFKANASANGDDQTANGNGTSLKVNSKDPSRPRRKKARRACFACQRAHLTCGTLCLLLLCPGIRVLGAD